MIKKELLDKIYDELSIEELQELLNFLNNNWWDLNKIKNFDFKDQVKYLEEKDKKKLIRIIRKGLNFLLNIKRLLEKDWHKYKRIKIPREGNILLLLYPMLVPLIIILFLKHKEIFSFLYEKLSSYL